MAAKGELIYYYICQFCGSYHLTKDVPGTYGKYRSKIKAKNRRR
jgi:hypothetical protein